MNYFLEESVFNEEEKLQKLWSSPIVLIYIDSIRVCPKRKITSYYIPFFYKDKIVIVDTFD